MPNLSKYFRPSVIVVVSILIVAASFSGGIYVGYERRPAIEKVKGVLYQETAKPPEVDFSQFWEVWSRLEEKYVERSHIDRKSVV